MKIALLGYGRMGKAIEKIAIERGHEIVLKVDQNTTDYDISIADVAIDFSIPTAAVGNLTTCFKGNTPVVSGTTGWLDQYDEMVALCNQNKGGFIYASNFSLGVNLFFEINKKVAQLMNPMLGNSYSVTSEEIHHTKKLDAPSGTAISLAEGVIENTPLKGWKLYESEKDELTITAKRVGDVPGTHSITYHSEVDEIEIKHTAYNRSGFALGAVVAVEWLAGKSGVYTMKDVLGL